METIKDVVIGKSFNNWIIIKKLGEGGFGSVYKCQSIIDPTQFAALKIFCQENDALTETEIIRKLEHNEGVINMIECGYSDFGYIMIMDLQGINLKIFKELLPDHQFSQETSLRLLLRMIKILQFIHKEGIVHCDIKPSNFVVKGKEDIVLIDFGIAEYYLDQFGNKKNRKEHRGFRGTLQYASVNAHLKKPVSRTDDLVSAFFIYFENILGSLPWNSLNDSPQQICEKKIQFKESGIYKYTQIQMPVINSFQTIIENVDATEPSYNFIMNKLSSLFIEHHIPLIPIFNEKELSVLPEEEDYGQYRTVPSTPKNCKLKKTKQIDEAQSVESQNAPSYLDDLFKTMKEQLPSFHPLPKISSFVSKLKSNDFNLPFGL
ncbi:hypothetical protein ENUP19_0259G0034 [Entamoeba nuttalli]